MFIRKAVTEIYHHYKMDAFVIGGDFEVCVHSSGSLCVWTCMYVVGGGAVSVLLFYNKS